MIKELLYSFFRQSLYAAPFFSIAFLVLGTKRAFWAFFSLLLTIRVLWDIVYWEIVSRQKIFSWRYILLSVSIGLLLAVCGIFEVRKRIAKFFNIRPVYVIVVAMFFLVATFAVRIVHIAKLPKKQYLHQVADDVMLLSQNKADALLYPTDIRFQTNDKLFFLEYDEHNPRTNLHYSLLQAVLNHEHVFFAKKFPSKDFANQFSSSFLTLRKSYSSGSRSIYNLYEVAIHERPELLFKRKLYEANFKEDFVPFTYAPREHRFWSSRNIDRTDFKDFSLPRDWVVNKYLFWRKNNFPIRSYNENLSWNISVAARSALYLRKTFSPDFPEYSCLKILAEAEPGSVVTITPYVLSKDTYMVFQVEQISAKKEYLFPLWYNSTNGFYFGFFVSGKIRIYSIEIWECGDFSKYKI